MAADKVHNARTMLLEAGIGQLVFWKELGKEPEQVTAYFQICHKLLRSRLPTALVSELGILAAELEFEHCHDVPLLLDWQRRLSGSKFVP
jgi:hypothetical protein